MPTSPPASLPRPERAGLVSESRISVRFSQALTATPDSGQFSLKPYGGEVSVRRVGRRTVTLHGGPFDMRAALWLTVDGYQPIPVLPDSILDQYRSDIPLGLRWLDERHVDVRLFHPRGRAVTLIGYSDPDGDPVVEQAMDHDPTSGCWSLQTDQLQAGMLYGFRVDGPEDAGNLAGQVVCDPYGWVVAKSPGWPVRALSVVPEQEIINLPPNGHVDHDPRDLMIYEAHVKDVTQLSPDVPEVFRGRYLGVSNSPFPDHLKRIGMNAVEFLPLHVFDDREPPFGTPGNRWNETARNHWGYMSLQFFAPEPRYATASDPTRWQGADTHHLHQVRRMVRHLHERGIAVILDVVYNHVGNYGPSPLRHLDPHYWLRNDGQGRLTSASGCGNDFWTERPMARRMIVDSLLHWSRFYGIDGFRFDLAGLIDDGTLDTITTRLRAEHPGVILIAEPWGLRYDKRRFAVRGWSAWNDNYRDALRGHDAVRQHGALLGGGRESLLKMVRGSVHQDGGPFPEEWQSVNYLASHDYYNLGDFLRIALKQVGPHDSLTADQAHRLTPDLLNRYRLGLFALFTSRGMLMLHQGDEWARAKRVSGDEHPARDGYLLPRKRLGELDRDSYNRDDPTNWLDWSDLDRDEQAALVDYISQLARIRRKHSALRIARHANTHSLKGNNSRMLAVDLRVPGDRVIVLMNLYPAKRVKVELPAGVWVVLANDCEAASDHGIGRAREDVELMEPMSACLLVPRDTVR